MGTSFFSVVGKVEVVKVGEFVVGGEVGSVIGCFSSVYAWCYESLGIGAKT